MNHRPLLLVLNKQYFSKVLSWNSLSTEQVGKIVKIQNFAHYNHLVDINKIFSSQPDGQPIDRTGFAQCPINFYIERPWQIPIKQLSLDQALQNIVNKASNSGQKINLFWSGGIDSTAMVTAFLKHLNDLSQLRILYSPWSTYEHPDYIDFLKKFPVVELVDTSGTLYMDAKFDGIFFTGDGGDELTGSVDESFFSRYGYDSLQKPWQDFFKKHNSDSEFIDFCEQYFKQSGREIRTVLEARWWFYMICKNNSILHNHKLPLFLDYDNFATDIVKGFYDCYEFEQYIYWNTDNIMTGTEYQNWKQFLKDYCCDFDGFESWCRHKAKFGSNQMVYYTNKKIILKNLRWVMILSNGSVARTPNLPLLGRKEYQQHCGDLTYLFNHVN